MGFLNKLSSLFGNTAKTNIPVAPTTPVKKVLIVEDDKYLRDVYSELIKSEGYNVLTAENGQIGLQTVLSQKPDIILLDLMMPVMDGKTMLHQLRSMEEFKKTPVVILTNAGDAESMRQTQFFDNANAFLIKSNITPDDIVKEIKTFV